MLFLTPLFEQLPNVALAALVLVAGIGLFDIPELKRLWRIQRADFVLAIITALVVAVIGMLPGILIAVVPRSCTVVVVATHGRPRPGPGTHRFRDTDHVEDGELIPGLLIFRFDAPLFFANASIMAGELESLMEEADAPVERILVDAESITDVDTTGVQTLEELLDDLDELGVTFALARLRNAVRAVLHSAGLIERIGEENIYLEVDDGVAAFQGGPGQPGS